MEPGGQTKLNERNPKWINDDYVKFIRLGQLFVERSTSGVLAFICPHGFIDNPTFRGMRWELSSAYSAIYVLDLHGNAKKKEICPDGTKDENVFDIQQGVCIVFMIRSQNRRALMADVYHADLYGLRDFKYEKLNQLVLESIGWTKVSLDAPFYLFKPTKMTKGTNINYFDSSTLFLESIMGFQTHRDNFAIAHKKDDIYQRINDMKNPSISDEEIMARYSISNVGNYVVKARKKLRSMSDKDIENRLTVCQYRLFDHRWCFLDDSFMDRPRTNIFSHASNRDNIVFGIGRQGLAVGNIEWCLTTVSHYAMDANIFRRGGVTAAPLYLYKNNMLGEREPNLNPEIVREFEQKTGLNFTAESTGNNGEFAPIDLIDYVYAILYSLKYRAEHSDELKINYPQVPYPHNAEYFWTMVGFGAALRDLHTMDAKIDCSEYDFSSTENTLIEKNTYKDGKIYVNKNAYFTGKTMSIDQSLWDYTIGGNQPLQKWLKDRKGTTLTAADIAHYKRMLETISMTKERLDKIAEECV